MSDKKLKAGKTLADPRWQQVLARDGSADGQFLYSVKTTGIYCLPSCGARSARPENVDFHLSLEEAEAAGYRPCQRCKPDQPRLKERHAENIANVCRFIEQSQDMPSLDTLAKLSGLSTYHFHRIFKQVTGLTPKAYTTAHRSNRLRDQLDKKRAVTEAIYEAGYNTSSRFYESSNHVLGMTPSQYRQGGRGIEIRFAIGECTLGSFLVAVSERGICAISLGSDPECLVHDLQDQFRNATLIGADQAFEAMVAKIVGFIESPEIGLDLPLDIRGTVFQQRVWQALLQIPAGTTVSYTEIANRIGNPKAVRAVASACAANTLAVAVPCHRVVRSDGSLSGYRWGVERKEALLKRERSR